MLRSRIRRISRIRPLRPYCRRRRGIGIDADDMVDFAIPLAAARGTRTASTSSQPPHPRLRAWRYRSLLPPARPMPMTLSSPIGQLMLLVSLRQLLNYAVYPVNSCANNFLEKIIPPSLRSVILMLKLMFTLEDFGASCLSSGL